MSGERQHAVCWFIPWFGVLYRCSCGRFERRPYEWSKRRNAPGSESA